MTMIQTGHPAADLRCEHELGLANALNRLESFIGAPDSH